MIKLYSRLTRPCLLLLLLAGSLIAATPEAAAQDTTTRGQRWEKAIASGGAYNWISTKLCVQYTSPTGSSIYTGLGFWDNRPASGGDNFKIRAAFNETGTWSWQLLSNATAGCVSTTGFSPASGTVTVNSDTTGLPLYQYGPVRVNANKRFLNLSGSAVLYPFFWIGDTTWSGTYKTYLNPGWANYLTDRKTDGLNVIEVAVPLSGDLVQPTDVTGRKPFGTYSGGVFTPCTDGSGTNVFPVSTCFPNKDFWNYWDLHINAANAQGMLVSVVGLFNRTTNTSGWPAVADSQGFARYVAARLAGNYTTLSPGFDELPDRTESFASCSGTQRACRARSVGTAIREAILLQAAIDAASPRQGNPLTALVTHHIGGGCSDGGTPCLADYWLGQLQGETWLDFQLFQSGQGKNCPAGLTQLQCLTQRASTRPRTLYNHATTKPIVNGEGVYDQFGFEGGATCPNYGTANSVYTALRARQAAFYSLLSGSVGYTHGIGGTWDWNGYRTCRSVSESLAAVSSAQMGGIQKLFQPFRWNRLSPDCENWTNPCTDVKNTDQNSAPLELKRMFARDSLGTFAIAYLPAVLTADSPGWGSYQRSLRLDLSELSSFTIGGSWATNWYDPRNSCVCSATPVADSTFYRFDRSGAVSDDWGLVLRNTSSWPNLAVPVCGSC